jgi:hypothetical protein
VSRELVDVAEISSTACKGMLFAPAGAVISGTVIGRSLSAASLGPTLDGISTLTVTVAATSLTVPVAAARRRSSASRDRRRKSACAIAPNRIAISRSRSA